MDTAANRVAAKPYFSLSVNSLPLVIPLSLAVEADGIDCEVLLPLQADQEELGGDEFQQGLQLLFGDTAAVVGEYAAAAAGEPDLGGAGRGLALGYVNVERLVALV